MNLVRKIVAQRLKDAQNKAALLTTFQEVDMTKARKDELALTDMVSPTFGIQDSGSAGGMLGTTIINPPTSAIMGTNAVTQRAAVVNGKVVARPIMYLSLTYDHRLIDGREAVTFLVNVRDKMEDPMRMLLDL